MRASVLPVQSLEVFQQSPEIGLQAFEDIGGIRIAHARASLSLAFFHLSEIGRKPKIEPLSGWIYSRASTNALGQLVVGP